MDKKLNQIDYSPLIQNTDVWGRVIRNKFKVSEGMFFAILLALMAFSLFVLGPRSITIIILLIVFGLIPYLAYYVEKMKIKVWEEFATVNGWKVLKYGEQEDINYIQAGLQGLIGVLEASELKNQNYIPPGLIGVGHSSRIGDIVRANFEGHECDVFSYQFTVGSGKNSKTYYYTIARVFLAKPFPHLILDSKHTWTLLNRDLTDDSVKLEGDFGKYFKLYFKKNGHIDALSIITPDIMQTLISSNSKQDIEIVGQNIFFMVNSDVINKQDVPALFSSVDILADEIKHKAKSLNYKPEQTEERRLAQQIVLNEEKSKQKMVSMVVMTLLIVMIPIIISALIVIFIPIGG